MFKSYVAMSNLGQVCLLYIAPVCSVEYVDICHHRQLLVIFFLNSLCTYIATPWDVCQAVLYKNLVSFCSALISVCIVPFCSQSRLICLFCIHVWNWNCRHVSEFFPPEALVANGASVLPFPDYIGRQQWGEHMLFLAVLQTTNICVALCLALSTLVLSIAVM